MVQGCTSDAGKTTLVAGLCRVLYRRGLSVAPFKPQNMAPNSAVTEDGGEIGRAQALQAMAAKVPLSVHLNPVLLKPHSDTGVQVILQGHPIGNLNAMEYQQFKPKAAKAVFDSFQILSARYPYVLVEGAGSPAEVNLRANDIANMGFAEAVNYPVILIADIDRGGVFAHIIGTLACLSESEKNRIKGFVINQFRGDITLLQDGLDWLEAKTGKPVLGVLPYLHDLHLDSEDSIKTTNQETNLRNISQQKRLKVIAPLLPNISNHTDLDPLSLHPQVDFEWVKHNQSLPPADLVILSGSKNVLGDLAWLKEQAWSEYLQKHLRYGGRVIGISAGLQMLGQQLFDPQQLESDATQTCGFGLMPYSTTFQSKKKRIRRTGQLNLGCLLGQSTAPTPLPGLVNSRLALSAQVSGYQISNAITDFGESQISHYAIQFDAVTEKNCLSKQPMQPMQPVQAVRGNAPNSPTNKIQFDQDGLISSDKQILTTYCHGLFDQADSLHSLLNWAGLVESVAFDLNQHREQQIERLADAFEKHLDIEQCLQIMQSS